MSPFAGRLHQESKSQPNIDVEKPWGNPFENDLQRGGFPHRTVSLQEDTLVLPDFV